MPRLFFGVLTRRPAVGVAKQLVVFFPVLLNVYCRAAYAAVSPDYLYEEQAIPPSVEQAPGPLADGLTERRRVLKRQRWLNRSLEPFGDFIRNGSLGVQARSYFFDRERQSSRRQSALAAGGSLAYRSDWWRDRVRFGAVVYSSQKILGDRDHDGTLLLRPRQKGFSVLGQGYVDYQLRPKTFARFYRQTFKVPYVNRNDNRMVPNTFEAYGVQSTSHAQWAYLVAHVRQIKIRNANRFVSMSEAAGVPGGDEALNMAGARYRFGAGGDLGAMVQRTGHFMHTSYGEANALLGRGSELALRMSAQYTEQHSIGEQRGGHFDTDVIGLKASASYRHATVTVAHTSTDEDSAIRSPFGAYPGYISLMVKDFNRAGEEAYLIGFGYEFSRLGWPGLSGFVNYARGDTPDVGPAASPDQREWDVTLDYRFDSTALRGLWLRVRAATVRQQGGLGEDLDDVRIIVNYDVPFE